MDPPFDAATAYHEAGHAVVALALGRPVHRVSVLPDRERLGLCEFGKGVFRPSEDWLEREILIALGGIAAEARHTGDLRLGRRRPRLSSTSAAWRCSGPASARPSGSSAACWPRPSTCWPRTGTGGPSS